MELLAERGLAPVVICESAGTQAEDACTMQQLSLIHISEPTRPY